MTSGASSNLPESIIVRVVLISAGNSVKVATCELWTHPVGGEIRIDADGEFLQSEAGHDGFALIDKANEWQEAFIAKGWSA